MLVFYPVIEIVQKRYKEYGQLRKAGRDNILHPSRNQCPDEQSVRHSIILLCTILSITTDGIIGRTK